MMINRYEHVRKFKFDDLPEIQNWDFWPWYRPSVMFGILLLLMPYCPQ